MKYTRQDLKRDFPDDNACLEWLKEYLNPEGIKCTRCMKITPHHRLRKVKAYSCEYCGNHYHPTANTIFHKSSTPLTMWFDAIFIMSATRAGISAKQLERELGVTYKTAWRMFHQIRTMMVDESDPFTGEVEIDESVIHPNPQRRRGIEPHTGETVFGVVQRGGGAKIEHVQDLGRHLLPSVEKSVDKSAQIYSDSYHAYKPLKKRGYKHETVNHRSSEWARGNVHTQSVENLWAYTKRGLKGVYIHVDPKYLQAYMNEYSFRYSHREHPSMFWALLGRVEKP